MPAQKWLIKFTPLYETPGGKKQNVRIFVNRIYDLTGNREIFRDVLWSEITFKEFINSKEVERKGWVQDVYLEDYVDDPDSQGFEVLIPHPTPDSTDAAQYMKWEKPKHVNMCGELCVAFIAGEDIETFLTKWKQMDSTRYDKFVPIDAKTGPDEVNNMLMVYGYPKEYLTLEKGLTDEATGSRKSPGKFQRMLATNYLIAAVRIDNIAGNIIGGGKVGHWVVVDKVIADGVDRGWVEIYNPFPNKRQVYSYDEFTRSCNAQSWTGLWVSRTVPSPGN